MKHGLVEVSALAFSPHPGLVYPWYNFVTSENWLLFDSWQLLGTKAPSPRTLLPSQGGTRRGNYAVHM